MDASFLELLHFSLQSSYVYSNVGSVHVSVKRFWLVSTNYSLQEGSLEFRDPSHLRDFLFRFLTLVDFSGVTLYFVHLKFTLTKPRLHGWNGVSGIATSCGLNGQRIEPRWAQNFPCLSRLCPRPTQPFI